MMRKLAVLALFLLPSLAGAQSIKHPAWIGTTANLPACNAARDGTIVAITDAPATPDCSTGLGSVRALCQCTNGTGWGVIQGAGGSVGTDDIGTDELDDDANTPTAGDFVVVEAGALSFDYVAPPSGGTDGCSAAGDKPIYTASTGSWSCGTDGGGASGAFSDASDPIVQNTITKDVHVGDGAGTLAGKLEIGGDADQPQLVIEGFSTQTDSILIVQNDADSELFSIDNNGSVNTAPSATPTIVFKDSDGTDADDNATISGNLTDTGSGSEDMDLLIKQQIAGTLTTRGTFDADGTVLFDDLEIEGTTDCSGIATEGVICWETDADKLWMGDGSAPPTEVGTGSGAFSDAADPIVQNTITKDVHVGDGAGTLAGKLEIGGDADQPQLVIEGFSTQTDSILVIQNDADTEVFTVANDGTTAIGTGSGTITGSAGGVNITLGASDVAQIGDGGTTDYIEIDENGVQTFNGAATIALLHSEYWGAQDISADGTQCTDPAEVTLNSGPKLYSISCADNAASIVYGSRVMEDSWNAGTVTFELMVWHGTTETITFAGDFSAQCRAAGEVPSATWGTAIAADVSISTANQIVAATTAAVTAAGTCAAGDMLFWRWVMDDVTADANAANTDILGVKMEYTANDAD